MLLICGDDEAHNAMEADGSFVASCHAWADEMQQRGVLVTIGGLQAPSDATTVRLRGDQVLLTDGPFAETKELIGGFSLIECSDLDEALEVTAKHPAARYGTIEIRPLLST
jgi:hypothetical protein